MFKRDPHFRNQFRQQVETGERHQLELDMWHVLARIARLTLIIRGTRSDMFAAITVPDVVAANPRFTLVEVGGGHTVAGDNPDGFHLTARGFWTQAARTTHRLLAATHTGFAGMSEAAEDKAAPGERARPHRPRQAGGRWKATATA